MCPTPTLLPPSIFSQPPSQLPSGPAVGGTRYEAPWYAELNNVRNCDGAGYAYITSLSECAAVASYLGLPGTPAARETGPSFQRSVPRGCHVYTDGDWYDGVWYNPSTSSVADSDDQSNSICRVGTCVYTLILLCLNPTGYAPVPLVSGYG